MAARRGFPPSPSVSRCRTGPTKRAGDAGMLGTQRPAAPRRIRPRQCAAACPAPAGNVEGLKELAATMIRRLSISTWPIQCSSRATMKRLDGAATPALIIVAVGLIPVILALRMIRRSRADEDRGISDDGAGSSASIMPMAARSLPPCGGARRKSSASVVGPGKRRSCGWRRGWSRDAALLRGRRLAGRTRVACWSGETWAASRTMRRSSISRSLATSPSACGHERAAAEVGASARCGS